MTLWRWTRKLWWLTLAQSTYLLTKSTKGPWNLISMRDSNLTTSKMIRSYSTRPTQMRWHFSQLIMTSLRHMQKMGTTTWSLRSIHTWMSKDVIDGTQMEATRREETTTASSQTKVTRRLKYWTLKRTRRASLQPIAIQLTTKAVGTLDTRSKFNSLRKCTKMSWRIEPSHL